MDPPALLLLFPFFLLPPQSSLQFFVCVPQALSNLFDQLPSACSLNSIKYKLFFCSFKITELI